MSLTPRLPVIEHKGPEMVRYRRHQRTTWPSSGTGPTTHKPALVSEIDAYLQRETFLLEKGGAVTPETMFQLYRECFGVFTTHFNDYAPFLSRVLQHFDAVLLKMNQLTYQNGVMKNDLSTVHEHQEALIRLERTKLAKERSALDAKMKGVQLKYDESQNQLANVSKSLAAYLFNAEKKDAEFEEIQYRANTVTQALREQSIRQGKLVFQLKKIRADRDRLHTLADTYQQALKVYSDPSGVDDLVKANPFVDTKNLAQMSIGLDSIMSMKSGVNGTLGIRRKIGDGSSGTLGATAFLTTLNRTVTPGSTVLLPGAAHRPSKFAFDCDEDVKEELLELQGRLRQLQRSNAMLEQENRILYKKHLKMIGDHHGQAMTPRARWKRVMEIAPSISINLQQSSDDVLSDLIEVIVDMTERLKKAERLVKSASVMDKWLEEEELTEHDLKSKKKTFVGLGTGPNVPPYFRFHGPIRNLRLKKGEIEGLLEEIWKDRKATLLNLQGTTDITFARLRRVPFETFVFDWLQRRTGDTSSAVELAYNIMDGCERYRSDPDCEMFLRIIRGQLSDEIYLDQLSFVETLRKLFCKVDKAGTKVVPRRVAFRLMSRYFATTAIDDVLKLRYTMMTEYPGETVNYHELFYQNEHGDQSRFVLLMRDIHLRDCIEFAVDIEEACRAAVDPEGMISLRHARDAISALDPAKKEEDILVILALGAGCSSEQVATLKSGLDTKFPLEELLTRLRSGLLKRSTRREHPRTDASADDEENDLLDAMIALQPTMIPTEELSDHEDTAVDATMTDATMTDAITDTMTAPAPIMVIG